MNLAQRAYWVQSLGRRSRCQPRGTRSGLTSASSLQLDAGNFIHEVRTDASGVARSVVVGTSTAKFGEQKRIVLAQLAGGSDSFTLDAANFIKADGAAASSITFNALNQHLLCEFNGTKWRIISSNAIIT
jgi:hypothetical protein